MQSRKASTRRICSLKWKRFAILVTQTNVNPVEAQIPRILDYVLLLQKQSGLAFISLKVHRTAISVHHVPAQSHSIYSHPIVSRFIKSLFHDCLLSCTLSWIYRTVAMPQLLNSLLEDPLQCARPPKGLALPSG